MRRLLLCALAGAALLTGPACDKVTPVAPAGSTITLSINPSRIAAQGESATVTAIIRKDDGTPVNTGTQINFSTTLGTLDPEVANTDETGVAKTTLTGDGRIGTATVSATTGAAAEVTVDVQVGSVAASITLNASPTEVSKDPPPEGEMITLTATIRDDTGALLPNITVSFDAEIGTVDPIVASTGTSTDDPKDPLGQAISELTITRNSLLALDEPFFEVTAETAFEGGALQGDTVEIFVTGAPARLTLQANPGTIEQAGGSSELLAIVRDSLGGPLEGAAVNFLTDAGALSSGGVIIFTDASGAARDTLTATKDQLEILGVGASINVSAETVGFAGAIVDDEVEIRIQSSAPVALIDLVKLGNLQVQFRFAGTGIEPLTFQWDFFDDSTPANKVAESTQRDPLVTFTTQGKYLARLTVFNEFAPPPVGVTTQREFQLP